MGWFSHRFNLAVKDLIEDEADIIDDVKLIMKKLSRGIPAAKLKRLTALKAQTNNSTRWSSTFHMIKRYIDLKPFIVQLDDPEIFALRLSGKQHNRIDKLYSTLSNLNSITLKLQENSTNISIA